MLELSLSDLVYLAAKARLPAQLVLRAARETCERFLETAPRSCWRPSCSCPSGPSSLPPTQAPGLKQSGA